MNHAVQETMPFLDIHTYTFLPRDARYAVAGKLQSILYSNVVPRISG